MATSAALQAAQKKYDAQNTRVYTFKLNNKTDADLISYLDSVPNKQGAIKTALREHIERRKNMKKIIIKTECLYFTSPDGEDYKVNSHNGSGLFEVTDRTNGENKSLTENEIKKYGGNVTEICDVLDLLRYADGETYYTDDDMNYISRQELERMPAEYRDDYEPVEFETE